MHKNDLVTGNIRRMFLHFLIPSIGGMMGTSLYVLGDTMLVGRGLGSQGLAALNISIPLINVFNGLGLLFGIGGATAISISRGREEFETVDALFSKAMSLSVLVGIILTLIRVFYLDELCYFLGASEATFAMSRAYLGVLMSFSIAFILNSALAVFVRNDGAPRLAMWSMLTGSILNVILDYIFIFIFQWGMAGAALATVISPLVGLAILSTHFIKRKNKLHFAFPKFQLDISRRIIFNGGSSFIVELSAGIVIFSFNQVILGLTGDLGVSAYSIIANLSLICTAIFIGVGQAIQPIVSFNYGAGKMKRVYESVRLGIFTAFGLGVLFYLTGLIFPEFLVSIFTKDTTDLMQITVRGIRLYFLAFLFMGLNIVMTSYVQSMEQARIALVMSLARGFVLILASLLVLPRFFGLAGVWLTLPLVETATVLLSGLFFVECNKALRYSIQPQFRQQKIKKLAQAIE